MKKIISIILILLSILCYGSQVLAESYSYNSNPWKYEEYLGVDLGDSDEYYNVKIDGIYYNIEIYKNSKGKFLKSKVESVYAVRKGKVLKYPDKIKFKGHTLKVDDVSVCSIYDGEYSGDYKFPYKEIYTPKYAKSVMYHRVNLKNLKKIYLSKNICCVMGLSGYPNIKVVIDKKNKYIKMKTGAIYSKNGKELRTLVNAKKTYKISKGTKEVNIIRNNKVEKLVFPDDLKKVNSFSNVSYCNNLKTIKFGKNTERVSSSIKGCNSLKKIDFGEKLKWFQGIIRGVKALESIEFPATLESLNGCYIYAEKLNKIIFNNEKHAPKIKSYVFSSSNEGLSFYVKNQTVADELLNEFQTKQTDVKNANIYVGDTLVYSNINYSKTN